MIVELAATTGLNPKQHSLRELVWAHDAKQRSEWDHTAQLVATILNSRMGVRKHDMVSPAQVHPFLAKRSRELSAEERREAVDRWFGKPKLTK